ncbi:MAG: hypothetical protein ACRDU8_08995, partial [Egibacteraceae bacterium]
VRHRARLLAGQVPEGLDSELAAEGVVLAPQRLTPSCGCDDPARVCQHVAGVWLAAADLAAADPFIVLRVGGRGRERLLADVAASRTRPVRADRAQGIAVSSLSATGWTRAAGDLADLELGLTPPPPGAAGPLRLLGDPPGWAGGVSAADLLGPLVVRAADWARQTWSGDDPAAAVEAEEAEAGPEGHARGEPPGSPTGTLPAGPGAARP